MSITSTSLISITPLYDSEVGGVLIYEMRGNFYGNPRSVKYTRLLLTYTGRPYES